jgi:hypothetical protein
MDKELLDLYSDYLISSFGSTTATGLSTLLEGAISHDQITRFLAGEKRTSADYWQLVKPIVRKMESPDGVLIVDDSIEEKPYTDPSDLICYHYDHSKDRCIRGINFLTVLYHSPEGSVPVAFDLVTKTEIEVEVDKKTGKEKKKKKSAITKNERYRNLLEVCVKNQISFKYVLNDVWFASAENMRFVKEELKKEFVMPLKSNRKIAVGREDKAKGRYVKLETLELEGETTREIYLEGVEFPVKLIKQVFTNGDGSSGILYLVTSDTTLTYGQITTIYHKRWKVEEYHQSLKQNASLAKSPTRTETTQTNHFFASLWAYVKLETLRQTTSLNHHALKTKLYVAALKVAFQELQCLKQLRLDPSYLTAA